MDDPKMYPDAPLSEDAGDASPASSDFSPSNAAFGGFEPAEPFQSGTYPSNADENPRNNQAYGTPGSAADYGANNASVGQAYGMPGSAAGYGSNVSAPQTYGMERSGVSGDSQSNAYGVSRNDGYVVSNRAPVGEGAYGMPQNNGYGPSYNREIQPKQSQAVSIVSLVFGILSVVCCWTFILPFIFGLVAIICGIVGAAKHQKKVLWLIGLIAGILGIVITAIMVVSLIPIITDVLYEMERHGGTLTPQDIQRIFREYGIEISIGAKLFGGFFF